MGFQYCWKFPSRDFVHGFLGTVFFFIPEVQVDLMTIDFDQEKVEFSCFQYPFKQKNMLLVKFFLNYLMIQKIVSCFLQRLCDQ